MNLKGATLVGFSMGGGEVARYIGTYGPAHHVAKAVFAAAVPPYLYKSADNPEGPRDDAAIKKSQDGLVSDRLAFLDEFTKKFFSVDGKLLVSEAQRMHARNIASFASPKSTLDCTDAFSRTDFRRDLATFKLPTLVIHGESDAIVPFEVSGARTHNAIPGSVLRLIKGAPHGFNVSHASEFNEHLLDFLAD